jgi:hypothetical protein
MDSKPEAWQPGRALFENPMFPKPTDEDCSVAATLLNITDEKRRALSHSAGSLRGSQLLGVAPGRGRASRVVVVPVERQSS